MTDTARMSITATLADVLGDDAADVETFLHEFYLWLRECGEIPERNKSMSARGAENYHARIDQLYRFVLAFDDLQAGSRLTHAQADELIWMLDQDELRTRSGDAYAATSKRKFSNVLKKYFVWLDDEDITAEPWEPNVAFTDGEHTSADSLTYGERHRIREEALAYGSLPAYSETRADERERINALLAQRLGKPISDVTRQDWKAADTSTKIGSLVAVTLETGMIPIEIENATLDWYDTGKRAFVVPTEYAAKNRPTNELPLTDATADVFSQWVRERRHLEAYDGTNRLWLNQRGNPYSSGNLCYLLRRLCEEANIDHENRKIVWYSLRHSLGHTFEETADISATKDQLRHQYLETTKNIYGQTATEKRRYTLEEINETARKDAIDETYSPYAPDDTQQASDADRDQPAADANTKHVDQEIPDTPAGRSDLARDILDPDD